MTYRKMSYVLYYTTLFFIILLPSLSNSLFYELLDNSATFIPSEDTILLGEIPEAMIENLLKEIPELREQLAPYINSKTRQSMVYEHLISDLPDVDNRMTDWQEQSASTGLEESRNKTLTAPHTLANLSRILRHIAEGNMSRRCVGNLWDAARFLLSVEYKMADCYVCGLRENNIPTNPICHEAFHSSDSRYLTLAPYLHAECFYSEDKKATDYQKVHREYYVDKPVYYAGDFERGCFKRFLDVGKVYTQRGCRKNKPWTGRTKSLVMDRYTTLERKLKGVEDGCVSSMHASLTPFARSVSLYARYYVCVCVGKYCNRADRNVVSYILYLLPIVCLSQV